MPPGDFEPRGPEVYFRRSDCRFYVFLVFEYVGYGWHKPHVMRHFETEGEAVAFLRGVAVTQDLAGGYLCYRISGPTKEFGVAQG